MRLPSIKTLTIVAGDRAKEVRELLEKKRRTRDYKSVQELEQRCFLPPDYPYRLMTALNEILEGYGIEAITESGKLSPTWEYINLGDTYTPTIMRHCQTGRIRVSDWGTIVENGNYQ